MVVKFSDFFDPWTQVQTLYNLRVDEKTEDKDYFPLATQNKE